MPITQETMAVILGGAWATVTEGRQRRNLQRRGLSGTAAGSAKRSWTPARAGSRDVRSATRSCGRSSTACSGSASDECGNPPVLVVDGKAWSGHSCGGCWARGVRRGRSRGRRIGAPALSKPRQGRPANRRGADRHEDAGDHGYDCRAVLATTARTCPSSACRASRRRRRDRLTVPFVRSLLVRHAPRRTRPGDRAEP
jgi:hypothetical protein